MIPEFYIYFFLGENMPCREIKNLCLTFAKLLCNCLLCAQHWPLDITLISSNSYNDLERYHSFYFKMKNWDSEKLHDLLRHTTNVYKS